MDPNADPLATLHGRRSTPARLLAGPGPDDAQLRRMLAAAVCVPDHGRLAPWRFLRIRGDTRTRLGELLAERARERDPAASEAALAKERRRFSFAPEIVAVVAHLTPGHKVPEVEQLLSGGAVCFALLQAAQALGFGAQWLTGWAAYDPVVLARLGLGRDERLLGFLHIGTARDAAPTSERPDAWARLTELLL